MYYKTFLAQMVDDDVIIFSKKGLFLGFFMTFFVFCFRFCLQTGFFFRSVNIGYYLKS